MLIGIDWGTSALRAYLLGNGGTVLASQAHPWGVMSVPGGDFAATYEVAVGAWQAACGNVPALASGMVGSSEGWIHAPYVPCPAGTGELAARLARITTGAGTAVHIVPGVHIDGSTPDVMRGEETQVSGALALAPELAERTTLVLPGTHVKWVEVRAGRIASFTTYLTGELYAVLRDHSILGRPARRAAEARSAPEEPDPDVFERGVRRARDSGLRGAMPLLFLTRSLVIAGELRPQDSLEYLSGLLIGEELRSALVASPGTPAIVGDPLLCERYLRAFAIFEVAATLIPQETAPAGLYEIARRAGLVGGPARV